MTYRPALVFALGLMPAASAAQLSDAGVSTALGYRQHLDVLRQCCPPRAWATFGEGRWQLHVDYLRGYREVEGYGGFPIDDINGEATSHSDPRGDEGSIEFFGGAGVGFPGDYKPRGLGESVTGGATQWWTKNWGIGQDRPVVYAHRRHQRGSDEPL